MELLCTICREVITGPHYARPEAPAFLHAACYDRHIETLIGAHDAQRAETFAARWGELVMS